MLDESRDGSTRPRRVPRARRAAPSNPTCFELARDGSDAAFEQLRTRHEATLYRYVLARLRNREDAEDVAQEFWLKVSRTACQVSDPDRFHGWFYSVARNCVLDFVRARRRRPVLVHVEQAADLDRPDPGAPDPARLAAEAGDHGEEVWRAVNALPPRYRTALALRGIYGCPYEDIAAHLGISRGAAEVLTSRARTRLSSLLRSPDAAPHTCLVALWYVHAVLEGEPTPAARRRLREHSLRCSPCAEWLYVLQQGAHSRRKAV